MNKHEIIESDLLFLEQRYPFIWLSLKSYINEFKATEKELEEEKKQHQYDIKYLNEVIEGITNQIEHLQRDVKRYFELIDSDEWMDGELENLRENIILKVGKEE